MTEELRKPLLLGAREEKEYPLYVLVFPNTTAPGFASTETVLVKQAVTHLDIVLEATQQLDKIYHVSCM